MRAKCGSSSTIRSDHVAVVDRRRDRRGRRSIAASRWTSIGIGARLSVASAARLAGRRRQLCCVRARSTLNGQVQRERAALARRALEADLAAEQARELAADREAETGAAVLAAGAAVGLLERLEDELLLLRARCRCRCPRPRTRRPASPLRARGDRRPARRRQLDLHRHATLLGELERVREQVLQDLLQALRIGDERARAGSARRRS